MQRYVFSIETIYWLISVGPVIIGEASTSSMFKKLVIVSKELTIVKYSSSEIRSKFFDIRSCNDSFDFLMSLFPLEVSTIGVDRLCNGASNGQIETISYGEEKPAMLGHTENEWSLNRRVELSYTSR